MNLCFQIKYHMCTIVSGSYCVQLSKHDYSILTWKFLMHHWFSACKQNEDNKDPVLKMDQELHYLPSDKIFDKILKGHICMCPAIAFLSSGYGQMTQWSSDSLSSMYQHVFSNLNGENWFVADLQNYNTNYVIKIKVIN